MSQKARLVFLLYRMNGCYYLPVSAMYSAMPLRTSLPVQTRVCINSTTTAVSKAETAAGLLRTDRSPYIAAGSWSNTMYAPGGYQLQGRITGGGMYYSSNYCRITAAGTNVRLDMCGVSVLVHSVSFLCSGWYAAVLGTVFILSNFLLRNAVYGVLHQSRNVLHRCE